MSGFWVGTTDRPISNSAEDEFEIQPYIEGLGEFILACQTPMTVAVQGNWGCGKTSMMNMVRNYLEEQDKIQAVWFNTWQFSQFNMDSQLTITFLQHFVKQISQCISEKDEKKKKIFNKVSSGIATVTKSFFRNALCNSNETIAGMINDIQEQMTETKDFADEVVELKNDFSNLINQVTEGTNRRFVIFIDDLDRLQPVHAVELLEVLKIFVDCENCVFVLAIDTSVVFQGIREKYGKDISDEKAQSFFDKMIQLPFKMPVANYKLDNMIRKMLKLEEKHLTKEDERNFIQLVKMASEGNPRSIKRIVNFYLLTEKVAESKKIFNNMDASKTSVSKTVLLAFSCIQLKYENLYQFFLKDVRNTAIDKLRQVKLSKPYEEHDKYDVLVKSLSDIGAPTPNENEVDRLNYTEIVSIFVKNCQKIITWEGSELNSENRKTLISLLRLTSLNDSVTGSV